MKAFLLPVLFLIINLCFSQSKYVTIIGNLPQEHEGEYLSFSKPIGKYPAMTEYIVPKDTATIKNNRFVKNLVISEPGIIYIFEKPFNGISSVRFFAEPGDTIVIERLNKEIIFSGKNAKINKMYSDLKFGPAAYNDEVYYLYKKYTTADKIIDKIKDIELGYFKFFENLLLDRQISKSCVEYTKLVIEQSIDERALSIAMSEEFRKEQKMQISKEDADKIVEYINMKYIPYKEKNLKSIFFNELMRNSALYLEKQSIKENKKINRFWNQFNEKFKSKRENFGLIDFIEFNDYKERYVGSFLLGLTANDDEDQMPINFEDLVLLYKAFIEKFPNSPYIIPISDGLLNLALDNLKTNINTIAKNKIESKILLGNLAIYDKTLEAKNTTPFANTNQSLVDAIAEKFPNQDLFIDFWATWCGPCIKQFTYNNDLHTFLDTKNIKTLYLSVDKEENIIKWEKYIQDYNLKGYHFLANNIYREKFIEPLGETIPRYFIFNSKTKKLNLLKGLPQEKEIFYDNITKALLIK